MKIFSVEKKRKKNAIFMASFLLALFLAAVILVFCNLNRLEQKDAPAASLASLTPSPGPQISFEGKIVFQSDMDGDNELYLLTKEGWKQLTDNHWNDEFPRVSPDGQWVAFSSNRHGNYDIFVMAMDGSRIKRLTASPHDESELAWFPEGKKIAYTEERKRVIGRSYSLWSVDLLSGERQRILPDFGGSSALPDFNRYHPLLTFTGKKTIGWDIFLADLKNDRINNLTENGQTCRSRFSPDGRWIVYVSHEADHKGDIFLLQPDGKGKNRLTERPQTFDYFPAWSPDGRYVVFCSNARSMYAAEGDWDLYIVEVATKEVRLLFAGPGRDVFPEWIE